jgi:hypothetical protein
VHPPARACEAVWRGQGDPGGRGSTRAIGLPMRSGEGEVPPKPTNCLLVIPRPMARAEPRPPEECPNDGPGKALRACATPVWSSNSRGSWGNRMTGARMPTHTHARTSKPNQEKTLRKFISCESVFRVRTLNAPACRSLVRSFHTSESRPDFATSRQPWIRLLWRWAGSRLPAFLHDQPNRTRRLRPVLSPSAGFPALCLGKDTPTFSIFYYLDPDPYGSLFLSKGAHFLQVIPFRRDATRAGTDLRLAKSRALRRHEGERRRIRFVSSAFPSTFPSPLPMPLFTMKKTRCDASGFKRSRSRTSAADGAQENCPMAVQATSGSPTS